MPAVFPSATPYSNPLIGRSQHAVHFYESDEDFASSVAAFFLSGLLRGRGCVAIVTHAHRAAILCTLEDCGIDVEHAMRVNQLTVIDAEKALGDICSSGTPDKAVFSRISSDALQAVSLQYPQILMFGEMVGMLTARGERQSALLFERWCNESLAQAPEVQMFCAYPKSAEIPPRDYETICCAHTAVL